LIIRNKIIREGIKTMSIANALGLTNEQFIKILEKHRDSCAIKYSEQTLNRELTEEEMECVVLDCEVSKQLNTGNTDALKKYGIEL